MSNRSMPLEQALQCIHEKGVFLHYDAERGVDLWTPHTKMPLAVRRAVVKHRAQLLDLLRSGAWEVCPNPTLHRKYSRCEVKCGVCARIECAS